MEQPFRRCYLQVLAWCPFHSMILGYYFPPKRFTFFDCNLGIILFTTKWPPKKTEKEGRVIAIEGTWKFSKVECLKLRDVIIILWTHLSLWVTTVWDSDSPCCTGIKVERTLVVKLPGISEFLKLDVFWLIWLVGHRFHPRRYHLFAQMIQEAECPEKEMWSVLDYPC